MVGLALAAPQLSLFHDTEIEDQDSGINAPRGTEFQDAELKAAIEDLGLKSQLESIIISKSGRIQDLPSSSPTSTVRPLSRLEPVLLRA